MFFGSQSLPSPPPLSTCTTHPTSHFRKLRLTHVLRTSNHSVDRTRILSFTRLHSFYEIYRFQWFRNSRIYFRKWEGGDCKSLLFFGKRCPLLPCEATLEYKKKLPEDWELKVNNRNVTTFATFFVNPVWLASIWMTSWHIGVKVLRYRGQLSTKRETIRRRVYEIFPSRNRRNTLLCLNLTEKSFGREMGWFSSGDKLDSVIATSGLRDLGRE